MGIYPDGIWENVGRVFLVDTRCPIQFLLVIEVVAGDLNKVQNLYNGVGKKSRTW